MVRKNVLRQRIESEGFRAVIPCDRCVRLHKVCFKSESSDRCSECVRGSGVKCEMSKPTYSDAEWRRLVKLQQQIAEERRDALAKVMRLERQESLLRSRAGDFIARDYKEIAELEDLERREKEESERLEKERKAREEQENLQKQRKDVEYNAQLASMSDDPSLTQMLNSPSFWENFDSAVAGGIPSPTGGNQSSSQ
ncbi:uncharacterized protein ACHE_60046A [Aspergillus chevalieri]|uniref:Uncharacterized protein n=1 Tax=Aspergillus chevalieri TaxID=182096 RepID=A0A7R7VSW2_ASPCH|nr:uncharacterized protein ACHE_60046A [Aspergillus chevalieri]BCR90160.1 hypothetical protein ACHE_60046A [Aspergillus chevalieri]